MDALGLSFVLAREIPNHLYTFELLSRLFYF